MRFRAVRELLLLLPQLAGLIARLTGDPRVPTRVKAILGVTAVYLASPIDLIPDFIPGLGYLDDVIIASVVVDGLVNYVDRQIILEHWPGDPASLERMSQIAAGIAGWVPRRWKARVFGPPPASQSA
jgi:uncharacterized membrane protein YkvA (DUF1232 family)